YYITKLSLDNLTNRRRNTSNNPSKDNNRDPVTNTEFSNLLPEPHKESCTCCENDSNQRISGKASILDKIKVVHTVKPDGHTIPLNESKYNCTISSNLS